MKTLESISLTPQQRHLLSVIDGELDEGELSFVCGESGDSIKHELDQLAAGGLVAFQRGTGEIDQLVAPVDLGTDEHPLSKELRTRIDELFVKLETVDHYAVLGVSRDAEKKAIKNAYYRLAKELHPDKHYGKNLGPYKKRIEAVFDGLTKAHDVLSNAMRRIEYDSAIGVMRTPTASPPPPEARSEAPQPTTPPPNSPVQPVSPRPGAGAPQQARPPSTTPRPSDPPGRERTPVEVRKPAPLTEEQLRARREALRRKLQPGVSPARAFQGPSPPAAHAPYVPPANAPKSAAEMLRERYGKVADEARDRRLRKYLDSAERAMAARDYATARAAYQQAIRLAPDDPELAVKAEAAAKLADG